MLTKVLKKSLKLLCAIAYWPTWFLHRFDAPYFLYMNLFDETYNRRRRIYKTFRDLKRLHRRYALNNLLLEDGAIWAAKDGISFKIDPDLDHNNDGAFSDLFLRDVDEIRPFKEYFHSILTKDSVLLDIGANMGQSSLLIAKRFACEVFAFEPHPVVSRLLEDNIKRNGLGNVHLIKKCVSDNDAGAPFDVDAPIQSNAISSQGQRLPSCTLDGELAHLKRLDIIKCDIQGAEMLMLAGAKTLIDKFQPAILLEICYLCRNFGFSRDDHFLKLKGMGYTHYLQLDGDALAKKSIDDPPSQDGDFLFLPALKP
ncbi:MAG: FkbM family methyltransferase [Elusimicrobia bacterium]|nr:FkbM family methyltransferase [Elusimicrobiota bacterium]